ncbi:hypothetical protein FRC11_005187 [Ceratobasidium sp. 423]|nr:hypothetical protein FRC11_005187 [Ceratobasidium sp. 423]
MVSARYAMTDPRTFAQIVEAQIDIWRNEGWLPECRGATVQHYIQGGSNADPILAEYYVKQVYPNHSLSNANYPRRWGSRSSELGVSVDDLYSALVTNAEKQPDNWNLQGRQTEATSPLISGNRVEQILNKLLEASRYSHSIYAQIYALTRQKYAFGDFCISQVAKGLNKTDDHEKYTKRASNFINSWDASVSIAGHTGFIQNKFQNGTFNFTDPRHCSIHDPLESTCYLNAVNTDGFYESSPIVYSQYVPHDTAKLIELQGGKDKFVKRLDWIFEEGYFDVSNEPSQQMPFMYHYADQPAKSTKRSREVISKYYNLTDTGIPGNDDSGAMASYAAFYLLGLYPLPATRQVLLSSPWFPTINITNAFTNSTTTINAINFKQDWDVFEQGGVVDLELGEDEGVECGELPASLSTGGYA